MRMKERQIKIPITENCVFAIRLDTKTEQEHIIIGELSKVQRYLRGVKDAKILINEKRPFGSFILECSAPIANQLADVRAILSDNTGKKKSPYFEKSKEILEHLWHSDNLIYRFVAVRIWQEYEKACGIKDYDLYGAIEKISLPLMFSLTNDIKLWQENDPQDPLYQLDNDYFLYPALLLYQPRGTKEYYAADISLMPLVVYYLKTVYKEKTYVQSCKLCGKLFRANTANIPTFCSEECKREQNKLNKQKFDEKAKDTPCETAYKKQYMYFYNRVKKLRKDAHGSELLAKVEIAFKQFCSDAVKRKKQVLDQKMTDAEFENWMFKEAYNFDELLGNV